MAKLIALTLLQTCIIGGLPRSPVEGVQMVPEKEAENLIDSGMAELADVDTADGNSEDEGDRLEQTKVVDLRKIAKDEGVTIEGDANKATIIAAIRDHREAATDVDPVALDGLDEAQLREVATAEGVTLVEDIAPADVDAIRAAIEAGRAPQA